jgi:hypothetical protein
MIALMTPPSDCGAFAGASASELFDRVPDLQLGVNQPAFGIDEALADLSGCECPDVKVDRRGAVSNDEPRRDRVQVLGDRAEARHGITWHSWLLASSLESLQHDRSGRSA